MFCVCPGSSISNVKNWLLRYRDGASNCPLPTGLVVFIPQHHEGDEQPLDGGCALGHVLVMNLATGVKNMNRTFLFYLGDIECINCDDYNLVSGSYP